LSPAAAAAPAALEAPPPPAPAPAEATTADADWQEHLVSLEALAGDLADQRLQLAEQWEQLARARDRWQEEHGTQAGELKFLAARLHEQGQAFLRREEELDAGARELRQRFDELLHQRHQLVGWQARLRTREVSWEAERDRQLAELRTREELAERMLAALVELRQRWAKRRRRELDVLQQERDAGEKVRQEYVALREERRRLAWEIEDERSQVTAKVLAVEQFRQQVLNKSGDVAAGERRVERLRRRWLTENANVLRNLQRERDAFQLEVTRLEERFAELQRRAGEADAHRAALDDKQCGAEHKLTVLEVEHERVKQEMQGLQAQRERWTLEADELRNEVERIARNLLDAPDAPTPLLEKAA
jgi:hypothetical protein